MPAEKYYTLPVLFKVSKMSMLPPACYTRITSADPVSVILQRSLITNLIHLKELNGKSALNLSFSSSVFILSIRISIHFCLNSPPRSPLSALWAPELHM
jgi:hypothetical protein